MPLIAKGCFYEIAQTQVRPAQNIKSLCKVRARNPLQLDKDCIYRINHLAKLVSIPVTVKLIAGQVPKTFGKTSSTGKYHINYFFLDPNKTVSSKERDGSRQHGEAGVYLF